MSVVIQIVGLVLGEPSPFDGEWLVEYDPNQRGVDRDGDEMFAHVKTTATLAEARRFTTAEALAYWKQVSARWPRRPDGKPNRPLTAFTVSIYDPEAVGVAGGRVICVVAVAIRATGGAPPTDRSPAWACVPLRRGAGPSSFSARSG